MDRQPLRDRTHRCYFDSASCSMVFSRLRSATSRFSLWISNLPVPANCLVVEPFDQGRATTDVSSFPVSEPAQSTSLPIALRGSTHPKL